MSIFSGKAVPDVVQKELEARRGSKGVRWTAQRFPWIHLTTMCSTCSEAYVSLHGAQWGYPKNNEKKIPIALTSPTITQVQIKKQGELGTTRKATVSITAYTDGQLIELQKCYFIPGMSVRVQWGWSVSANGFQKPSIVTNRNLTDSQAYCEITKKANANPAYDGLQGLVTNFSYNLTKDNYWECSLEIVAAAQVMLQTSVSYNCCPDCYVDEEVKDEEGNEDDISTKRGLLLTMLHKLYKDDITVNALKKIVEDLYNRGQILNKSYTAYATNRKYNGYDRKYTGTVQTPWYDFFGLFQETKEMYITWELFEAMVNAYTLPADQSGKPAAVQLLSKDLYVKYPPYVNIHSVDPRVCIIPGSPFYDKTTKKYILTDLPTPISGDISQGLKLDITKLPINVIFLIQKLNEVESTNQGTFENYIRSVLDGINNAIGAVGDFDLAQASEGCGGKGQDKIPTVTVIERKDYANSGVYSIDSLGTDSIVRDLKLELKLPSSLNSQALYSNTDPRSPAGDTCNKNTDPCSQYRFAPFTLSRNINTVNLAYQKNSDEKKKANFQKSCDECAATNNGKSPRKLTLNDYMSEVEDNVVDATVSAAQSEYISLIRKATELNPISCDGTPLPFEFSVTLDGIGGFRFGQAISSTRIPSSIRNAWWWQVTAVEHTITIQDWSTTINTVARYKNTNPIKPQPAGDGFRLDEELKKSNAAFAAPVSTGVAVTPSAIIQSQIQNLRPPSVPPDNIEFGEGYTPR